MGVDKWVRVDTDASQSGLAGGGYTALVIGEAAGEYILAVKPGVTSRVPRSRCVLVAMSDA